MPRPPQHYEAAFERYVRSRRIPYVSVDEARRALLPHDHVLRYRCSPSAAGSSPAEHALKSFDYVLYGPAGNLLVEVKGRRIAPRTRRATPGARTPRPLTRPTRRATLQSWVGLDDVESLKVWQSLFGPQFKAAFVFLYWCDEQPPDGLFQEVFDHDGSWYAVRAALLDDYAAVMKTRSPRWRTVHVRTDDFERISQPLVPALEHASDAPDGREPVYTTF